jgi:transposase
MATGSEILLTKQQQSDLSSIAQSRALPAGYVFRAKLILMLAEGSSFNAIKRQLQTTAPTIVRWKQRFRRYGLEGLDTYHPGQKPSVLTPALRARILSATRRKPSDGLRTGVAASWPLRSASAKTQCIAFGKKRA